MSDPELERWRALVDKGLKGAPFESLTATTLEGIPIAPLYTERDRPEGEGIPWAPRAERAMGRVIDDARDLQRLANESAAGAGAAWAFDHGLRIADEGAFDVPPGLVVLLEPLTDAHWVVDQAQASVRVVADAAARDDAEHFDAIARAVGRGVAAVGVAGFAGHPVDAVVEVAGIASSLVRNLRRLEARAVDPEHATAAATIVVKADTDFFTTIAKVRAVRRVVDRLLSTAGIHARPWIAARTASHVLAALDVPTNAIRNTLAAAAALIGGADVVATQPHDAFGARAPGGARLARTTTQVLALESHLAAAADPARGSAFIESLTGEICARAWARFTSVEAAGESIALPAPEGRQRRSSALVTRRRPLVGVSRFPVPGERPLPPSDVRYERGGRDSEGFELLRDRAVPAARVIALGTCPDARTAFAREVAQLAATRVDVVHEVALGDASFVILGAADAEVATLIPDAARVLRAAGAKAVAVAGKPGADEQLLLDAGVDAFVYVGADVVTALQTLLGRAGGKGA